MRTRASGVVVALALISACGKGGDGGAHTFGNKAEVARIQLQKFAFEAYGQWLGQHPTQRPPCPGSLRELTPFMNNDDVADPWGNPYEMHCVQSQGANGYEFYLTSLGADGKPGGSGADADLDSRQLKGQ